VTPTVAILALATAAAPPIELVLSREHVPLPAAAARVELEANPYRKRIALRARGGAAAIASALRGASRLCPDVSIEAGTVVLGCRTPRLRASIGRAGAAPVLELRELAVPPWRPAEGGPPLVLLDAGAAQPVCDAAAPERRGECALALGRVEDARRAFVEALDRGPCAHAELRLGDLALQDDEPREAVAHWRRARAEAPWGRLAAARLCELDPACLEGSGRAAALDPNLVAPELQADLALRALRLDALEQGPSAVVVRLAAASRPGGACSRAPAFCRGLLADALAAPPPEGSEALAAYLGIPDRLQGPRALELVRLAAAQAEAAGAPVFAARLLAAIAGVVGRDELPAHLLRTARLFLAGADLARAEEILLFARTRLPAAVLRSRDWAAVGREVRGAGPGARAAPVQAEAELTTARAALDAARLASLRKGGR